MHPGPEPQSFGVDRIIEGIQELRRSLPDPSDEMAILFLLERLADEVNKLAKQHTHPRSSHGDY